MRGSLHHQAGLAFLLAVTMALVKAECCGASGQDVSDPGETVLFAFDDYSIPAHSNLQLAMEPPEKHPENPVLKFGKPGDPDEWQLRYYTSIIWHRDKFMMWYLAMSREAFVTPYQGGPFDERGMRIAYAESADGIHWTKPSLDLVDFRGSRKNNLVQMPAGFRAYGAGVRCEPDDPDPTRRFKMMALVTQFGEYATPGLTARKQHRAFVPLYSPDGLRWRVANELVKDDPKAIAPEFHLPSLEGMGFYRWKDMYYLAGQGGSKAAMAPFGRHVQVVRSPDLLHWSETVTTAYTRQNQYAPSTRVASLNPDGTPVVPTNDNEQAHVGVSAWNRGNVLIGVTGFFHGAKDWNDITQDLGFLVSNDGLHFREPLPNFILARAGEEGRDWDHGGLVHGQGFANVGDKTYIWYSHMEERAYGPRTGGRRQSLRDGGVGVLVTDRDRFGSLSVRDPDMDGVLVSTDLTATPGVKLWVNVEGLGPESPLRIELLDHLERPLLGYSGTRAAVLTKSGLRVPVAWPDGGDQLKVNTPFKIKARLEGFERNAIRLYAFYLGR